MDTLSPVVWPGDPEGTPSALQLRGLGWAGGEWKHQARHGLGHRVAAGRCRGAGWARARGRRVSEHAAYLCRADRRTTGRQELKRKLFRQRLDFVIG